MAALLETMEPPAPSAISETIRGMAQGDAQGHGHTASVYKSKMPELVKGAGYCGPGGRAPLTDQTDILARSAQATVDLRAETQRGFLAKSSVVKSMNPAFLNKFGALATALSTPSVWDAMQYMASLMPNGGEALKSFTAGNLGIGSIPTRVALFGNK